MGELEDLGSALDGELLTPGESGYHDARRPGIARFRDVYPWAVVRCGTVADVVGAVAFGAVVGSVLGRRRRGRDS